MLKAHFTSRHPTHVDDNHTISLQTNSARFRAAGTLPILWFASADTPGLEVSYRVALKQQLRKEAGYNCGTTYQLVSNV